jgi:hypothetical protein
VCALSNIAAVFAWAIALTASNTGIARQMLDNFPVFRMIFLINLDLPLIERVTHQFRRDAFSLMARLLAE